MQKIITLRVIAKVDLERFTTLEAAVEHAMQVGDIVDVDIQEVLARSALVARQGVSSSILGIQAPPAPVADDKPGVSVNNPGSAAVAFPTLSASGSTVAQEAPPTDTAANGAGAARDDKPVTIQHVRARASELMALHPDNQSKVIALLRQFGAANMTALGTMTDVLPAFLVELEKLA